MTSFMVVLVLAAATVVCTQASGPQAAAAGTADKRLAADYAFVVRQGDREQTIGALRELKTGDQFKLRVRSRQPIWAYFFVSSDEQTFDLVLPKEGEQGQSASVGRNRWTELPAGDEWLRFDRKRGIERLYLVLATAKVPDIEDLIKSGRKAPGVDETWVLDLRQKYGAGMTSGRDQRLEAVTLTGRNPDRAPTVVVEEFVVRHK
jgi:hypothetical protein